MDDRGILSSKCNSKIRIGDVQLEDERIGYRKLHHRFHELALMCPRMVELEEVKFEQYL